MEKEIIGLTEREIKVLEAVVDNLQAVDLREKPCRIRDIYVVLNEHFRKNDQPINPAAIRYSVKKLEELELLKKVAKTKSDNGKNEKVVYEWQQFRFEQIDFVEIKNRYVGRGKADKSEKSAKSDISSQRYGWFKLEPYAAAAIITASDLEGELIQRRDEIMKEIVCLEKNLEQRRKELDEANDAINHVGVAKKFLEKSKRVAVIPKELQSQVKQEVSRGDEVDKKNILKLLPREKQILQEIIEYFTEKGGNQIKSIKATLSKHFINKQVKISSATIFHAVKGLEEVGLLRVVDTNKLAASNQRIFVYEFNYELFQKSEILVRSGLLRNLVSKSIRIKNNRICD